MANDSAKELTTSGQRSAGWGTVLDFRSKVPSQFAGLTFDQAWHDDIERFNNMTNKDKWIMGYWIEYQAMKRGINMGIVVGIVLSYIGFWIFMAIFGQ